MVDVNVLLRDVVAREENLRCYDIRIGGIPIYRFVRGRIRLVVEKNAGMIVKTATFDRNYFKLFCSNLISLWHLIRIILLRRKYKYVFVSFPRVDKVNGLYLDKFTDPVIEISGIKDYIIFDHGMAGTHPGPRVHREKIVYTDFLHTLAEVYAKITYKTFCRKHQAEIDKLRHIINEIVSGPWDENEVNHRIVMSFWYCKLYKYLFKRIHANVVAGPARSQLCSIFMAARQVGMRAYEFQHGIVYSECAGYSGKDIPEVEPDLYLAFGDNKPNDVYGVAPERMANIGWAFLEYLESHLNIKKYGDRDVLVVSRPEITEMMLDATKMLAEQYPDVNFHFRPHPHEHLKPSQMELIESTPNIQLQDKSINFMEVLYGFNHVIGESSTALYEALSMGKKVGTVSLAGLVPLYLEPEDKECVWEIHEVNDFETFLAENISYKRSKCIYSKFNVQMFNDIMEGIYEYK